MSTVLAASIRNLMAKEESIKEEISGEAVYLFVGTRWLRRPAWLRGHPFPRDPSHQALRLRRPARIAARSRRPDRAPAVCSGRGRLARRPGPSRTRLHPVKGDRKEFFALELVRELVPRLSL